MENLVKRFFFGRHRETWQGVLLDQPVENDARCRDCDGFCCRLFPTVNLTWSEFETLKGLGARRLSFSLNGQYKLLIENGCEFQSHGKCTIYSHRPDICRRFICHKKSDDRISFAFFPYAAELLPLRWIRRKPTEAHLDTAAGR